MKRKLICLFTILCMLATFVPCVCAAEEGVYGELVFSINDDNTITITDCDESATSVDIPAEIDGMKVTEIGYKAFYGCSSLANVTIPDGVASVGYYAFKYCHSLTSVTLPDSVMYIGHYAFSSCDSLTSITIPNSVTYIGNYAFDDCSSLTSITIPEGVTDIGYLAFCGCSSLTSVTIPKGVTDIGYLAFCGCSSLTSITIPDSVTYIGDNAFDRCSSLISVNVDSNNQNYCSVDGNLFNKDKTTLIQYAIGKTDISYSIPEGVTTIGDDAFYNCSSLTSVTIPDSVTVVDGYAFYGCDNLSDVYYTGTEEQWNSISISDFGNDPLLNATIHYNSIGIPTPSITAATVTGSTVTVDLADIPHNCIVAAATYSNGKYIGIGTQDVTSTDTQVTITLPIESADTVRVFLWDSLDNMHPLCAAAAAKL